MRKIKTKWTRLKQMLKYRVFTFRWRKNPFSLFEIDYINGSQSLPPPLSRQQEEKCVAEAAAGERKARDLLITHNLRLVVYIAKKFENTGTGIEDLISIGTIGLIKAVNTFKPDKNIKLATYASRCIENEILMFLRKTSVRKNEVSLDEPLHVDWDGNELLLSDVLADEEHTVVEPVEAEDERGILLRAVSLLPERDKLIVNMRFGLGGFEEHTQKEVADLMGISQSYISRLEKRIILRLKTDMEKAV